jgi:hypothetical protein
VFGRESRGPTYSCIVDGVVDAGEFGFCLGDCGGDGFFRGDVEVDGQDLEVWEARFQGARGFLGEGEVYVCYCELVDAVGCEGGCGCFADPWIGLERATGGERVNRVPEAAPVMKAEPRSSEVIWDAVCPTGSSEESLFI